MNRKIFYIFHLSGKSGWKKERAVKDAEMRAGLSSAGAVQVRNSRGGFTIVELVVAFAVMAVFAAGIARVMAAAYHTYRQMKSLNYEMQVSETLLGKIVGELEDAQPVPSPQDGGAAGGSSETAGAVLVIGKDRGGAGVDEIRYTDRSGSGVRMTVRDGHLLLQYDAVASAGQEGGTAEDTGGGAMIDLDAGDWAFDEGMYMGFEISKLTFSQMPDYPENVIKVSLTLTRSSGDAAYTATDYARCSNFSGEEEFSRIAVQ